MTEPVLARTLAIVATVAGPERTPVHADAETPLGEHGYWLDSVDVLEVILACEHEFDVSLGGPDDLTAESLGSVGGLADLIRSKVPGLAS